MISVLKWYKVSNENLEEWQAKDEITTGTAFQRLIRMELEVTTLEGKRNDDQDHGRGSV